MNKQDIQKIRIDIVSDDQSVLSMLFDKEGTISRQGNGTIPADPFAVMSQNDGSIFAKLIDQIDERVFAHAGVYDHPDKSGQAINYSVAMQAEDETVTFFEFRLGTQTKDVGELLPYFDQYISSAVLMTNEWYDKEKAASLAH